MIHLVSQPDRQTHKLNYVAASVLPEECFITFYHDIATPDAHLSVI